MFSVYFDESGTHGQAEAVVVGGYLSSADEWEEFDREWTALLAEERITLLHRVDLETFRHEFARSGGWDEKRRVRVLRAAHEIIRRRTIVGTGGAVIRRDFDDVMPAVVKRAFGGAYGWLVHECIVGVGHWAVNQKHTELIHYIFEEGARGRKQVDKMFKSLCEDQYYRSLCRIEDWRFVTKAGASQLQAADFFAYEVYKHVTNRIVAGSSSPRPTRKSALDLFRRGDQAHYWDKVRLARWVEKAAPWIAMLEQRERHLRAIGRPDLI